MATAAAAAAIAGIVGAAAGVAGTGVAVAGQIGAAQAAKGEAESRRAIADYNAKVAERVAEQEAGAEEQRAAFRQKRGAEAAERQRSALQASLAASGVVSGVGSPLLIQAEQAAEAELEMLLVGYEGQVGAARARSRGEFTAMESRLRGAVQAQRGRIAERAGHMGAGTTLLTGFGRAAEQAAPLFKGKAKPKKSESFALWRGPVV